MQSASGSNARWSRQVGLDTSDTAYACNLGPCSQTEATFRVCLQSPAQAFEDQALACAGPGLMGGLNGLQCLCAKGMISVLQGAPDGHLGSRLFRFGQVG